MYSALLFDLDGTLVNSLPLYYDVMQKALGERGVELTQERYRGFVRGSGGMRRWLAADYPELPWGEFIAAANAAYLSRMPEELDARPGVEKLLIDLLRRRLPLGMVSHSYRPNVESTITALEWQDVFLTIVSHEDVVEHKPHPEGYLLAAERLAVDPGECVVFEDSPAGVLAAKAAGMTCVACPDPSMQFELGLFDAADLVVSSLEDVSYDILSLLGDR